MRSLPQTRTFQTVPHAASGAVVGALAPGRAGPGPIPPHLLSKQRSTSTGSHVGTRGRVTRTPPRHTYASDQWTTRDVRESGGPAPPTLGAR